MRNLLFAAALLLHAVLAAPLRAQTARAASPSAFPAVAPVAAPVGVRTPLFDPGLGLAAPAKTLSPLSAPTLPGVPAALPAASAQARPTVQAAAFGAPTAAAAPARADAAKPAAADAPAPAAPPATLLGRLAQAEAVRQDGARTSGDQASPANDPSAAALFDGAAPKAREPKDWTFMVFLNGHNNLDSFGALNIKQMEMVGSNDRVDIVVQWASMGKPTKRMLIRKSEDGTVVTSPVLESLPAVDMGDADQLSEFIRWTVERFPARHYLVDVWNHGSGWHARSETAPAPLDISWDDRTGNHITTEQLGEVMRKAAALIGRPIDVLGFDACLMAMAEVVAEVAGSVRYFAGSEELEPGTGWSYAKLLRQWLAAPPDDGASLVKAIAEQFLASYSRAVTFSGLDLAKFPAFAEAAKALSREIAQAGPEKLAALRAAGRETRRYGYSDYGDFLDFVLKAARAAALSAPVVEAFAQALRAMVVVNGHSADRAGSNGLSAWLPATPAFWKSYGERYVGLAWHLLSEWGHAAKRLAGL